MLEKINKLSNWQAVTVLVIVGFVIFFTGLFNSFSGDDTTQIVNNIPVHSITNIRLLFEGGTFYSGRGLAPLSGVYFRPLMMTVFSLIYTIFGPHAFYFHLFQTCLYIGSAFMLFLFFKLFFKTGLAFLLALIFLVHPIDSEAVFSISATQDILFFFFGMLSMWLVLRSRSVKNLVLVSLCLFLSLLSKESAIVFIVLSLFVVFRRNRRRFKQFIGILVVPIALYLALRIHAVGLFIANPHNAPIDSLNLASRLLTTPSIILFYLSKFVFPLKLASEYYWTYSSYSSTHFLLPLLIDLAVFLVFTYSGFYIKRTGQATRFNSFVFFAAWSILGLVLLLPLVSLDMTASQTWFLFPIVGVLGMIGVFAQTIMVHWRMDFRISLIFLAVILCILGIRTAIWGTSWRNTNTVAYSDVKASEDDFNADNIISLNLNSQGSYSLAKQYAEHSVNIFPNASAYNTLGLINFSLADYGQAEQAYLDSLKLQSNYIVSENLARLTLVYGTQISDQDILDKALKLYPRDPTLWLDLSLLDYRFGQIGEAKNAISIALDYSQSSSILFVYNHLTTGSPFTVNISR